jgi:hypothetical protein
MYVAQDTTEIDGIEHKPLRIMGESDRVEVRQRRKFKESNFYLIYFSVLNNMYSIPY